MRALSHVANLNFSQPICDIVMLWNLQCRNKIAGRNNGSAVKGIFDMIDLAVFLINLLSPNNYLLQDFTTQRNLKQYVRQV